jgi:SP family general alpha glucoside:H+ symporter-like MFS transporter
MIQWVWPVPLLLGACFCPESAWYLVRIGKIDAAKNAIRRTARKGHFSDNDLDGQIALIENTLAIEEQTMRKRSIWNMFKGTNLRRLEIVSEIPVVDLTPGMCCVVDPVLVWPSNDRLRDDFSPK